MDRILHRGQWYFPIKSSTIYEGVYEQRILANSHELYPGYYCAPFKISVDSIHGTGVPDLVLIDEKYRNWIVVEVELEHHALHGDVLDQVKKFTTGDYGDRHAKYINSKIPSLDLTRLNLLIRGTTPSVLVLVPREKPSWTKSLLPYGATISVIEIWQNENGEQLLKVNNDQPALQSLDFISTLVRDGSTPQGLKVLNPASLPDLDFISILINNYRTKWRVIRTHTAVWLMPSSRSPLDELSARSFRLLKNLSEEYYMEEDYGQY